MEAFIHAINAVTLILLMISVGYFATKGKLMQKEHKPFIVKYLINIAVPAMCIANVFTQFAELDIENPLLLFVPPILSMLCTLLLALAASKLFHISHKRSGAFIVMCAFSNSIFVGLPMCRELFGDTAVPFVIIFYIVNTLMFWTVGIALIQNSASGEKKKMSPMELIRKLATPPLISLVVAVVLVLLKVTLPKLLLTFCGYLGDTVSPLALMYVGCIIAETTASKKGVHNKAKLDFSYIFAMLMRFVIAPIITLILCRIMGISTLPQNVFIAESAMPVMTQCVIVSAQYGGDEEYAATAMTLSTVLCLVAIPLISLLLMGEL